MKQQNIDFPKITILILSCILSLATILYSLTFFATRAKFSASVLPIALIITMLNLYYNDNKVKPDKWKAVLIWFFTIIMLVSSIYYWVEFYEILQSRVANYTQLDYLFVYFTIPLVIFLSFKSMGTVFGTVICLPFLIVFFGERLPEPFTVGRIGFVRFVGSISLELGGIWGPLTQAMVTYVGIFVIFAAVVRGFGGLESLILFFIRLLGKHEVLFPQVATFSSMMFGSFSGSAIANVAGTGTFTIPMMKMRGMKPENAAAVETIASTGGGIMPPIMGAAAFIMAELLGIGYIRIIFAGLLPALVFYLTTFLNVYWIRLRQMGREREQETDEDKELFEKRVKELEKVYDPSILWCLLASIIILMVLLIRGSGIMVAGGRTIIAFSILYLIKLLITSIVRFIKKTDEYDILVYIRTNFLDIIKNVINALHEAGKSVSQVILLGAALGIISSTLLRTGLLYKLGTELVNFALGNPYLLLLVTFILCVLLGMAISGLATYLLVVTIVVAAFRAMGVDPLVAHFIVFYCSMTAPITPPIAPAAAIAANLAQANFVKTCKATILMSQGLILMPLIFLDFPSILKMDFMIFIMILSAMFLISMGIYLEFRGMARIPNCLLVILGLSMITFRLPIYVYIPAIVITLLLVVYGIKNNGIIKFVKQQ